MSSTPRRRRSIDFPPDLSESQLMNKLKPLTASFIREFDSSEQKMREIVRKLSEIPEEVREMQERKDEHRTYGAVAGGAGILVLPALLTGVGSLLATGVLGAAAVVVDVNVKQTHNENRSIKKVEELWEELALGAAVNALGETAAVLGALGAVVVVGVNLTKRNNENRRREKVEELGEEFMEIVERLKNNLEEIMRTCEKLEQRSAEDQAEKTLRDMEEFQKSLSIPGRSDGVWSTMWNIIRLTATPEEDRKLRNSIKQSADLCLKVIDDLKKMKEELSGSC